MNRPCFVRAKDNPFAVQKVTALPYRFQSGDWESNLKRLAQLNHRAAIVGSQGTGKSTLLRDLAAHLTQRGNRVNYIFLPREKQLHEELLKTTRRIGARQITLLDGIERLSILHRLGLYLRIPRLVVTIHSPHRFPCRLPTWVATKPCYETLEYVIGEIGTNDHAVIDHAKTLHSIHRGNMRLVLRDLYDAYAAGNPIRSES